MSTEFTMSSLNRSNFAKIPTTLTPTFQNFHLIVMPVLSLICQQFEAQTGFPLSPSLDLPSRPPYAPNRHLNPELVQPLDIYSEEFLAQTPSTQRFIKENEEVLQDGVSRVNWFMHMGAIQD